MSRIIQRAGVVAGLGLGMLLFPLVARGQEPRQESEPTRQSSSQPLLPAPLGGFSPTLTLDETPTQTAKVFSGSIAINGLYSDNAFTASPLALDDSRYSIVPALGFRSVGPRTQWMLNYAGGVTVDPQLPDSIQQTHGVNAELRRAFTPRLIMEVRQDYTMTNNQFITLGAAEALPALVGPGELSPFAVPSPVTQIASISNANLIYILSQHSAAGVSGSFSLQHFRDVQSVSPSLGSLIDTTNTAGRAFYLRQVSRHHTIGAEYQLQNLRFDGGRARTVDQVLFLFDGISFKPNMTLSLYGGPEHTGSHNIAVLAPGLSTSILPSLERQWSAGGGVAYAWRGKGNGLRLLAENGVSDGGAWLGAVRLNTASLALQKALAAYWNAFLDLTYSDGHTIGTPASLAGDRVTTEEGLLGVSCRITRQLTASTAYARIRQPHLGPFIQVFQPNYNQIQAGLTYQFEKVVSK